MGIMQDMERHCGRLGPVVKQLRRNLSLLVFSNVADSPMIETPTAGSADFAGSVASMQPTTPPSPPPLPTSSTDSDGDGCAASVVGEARRLKNRPFRDLVRRSHMLLREATTTANEATERASGAEMALRTLKETLRAAKHSAQERETMIGVLEVKCEQLAAAAAQQVVIRKQEVATMSATVRGWHGHCCRRLCSGRTRLYV